MHIVYLTKGALATTAIEGNTLSEEEARRRIEGDLDLPPSREYLGREIDNVIAAYNEIKDELVAGVAPPMTRATIENYNRLILDGARSWKRGCSRGDSHSSGRGGSYAGAPREDCEFLLERLSEWLNGPDFAAARAGWELPMAIVKAIVAHLYIAWIHPFGDGNGRTARLMELRILLEAGVPTPATHLLSNHYNQTRTEYYRQLREASRGDGEVLPFIRYALQGFVDGLRDQLGKIRAQQFADRWEQYVYQQFGRTPTPAQIRQRQLVLRCPSSMGRCRSRAPKVEPRAARDVPQQDRQDADQGHQRALRDGAGPSPEKRICPEQAIIEAFRPVTAEQSETEMRTEARPSPAAGDHDLLDRVGEPPSLTSTTAPMTQTSSSAVSNLTGICVFIASSTCSGLTPSTLVREPVMPTSEMNAVPPGRTRASAVGTWVWVPKTAATRPSRCQPIATFSLLTSAWKSTTTQSASIRSRIASTSWKGEPRDLQADGAAEVDHADPHPARLDHDVAPARVGVRVVGGPDHPLGPVEEVVGLAVAVDVVAGGDHVGAGVEERLRRSSR